MSALVHPLVFERNSVDHDVAIVKKKSTKWEASNIYGTSSGLSQKEVGLGSRSVHPNHHALIAKKEPRMLKNFCIDRSTSRGWSKTQGRTSYLHSERFYAAPLDKFRYDSFKCGCGARSQFSGENISPRTHSAASSTTSSGKQRTPRAARNSAWSEGSRPVEKRSARSKRRASNSRPCVAGMVDERDARIPKENYPRLRSGFGFLDNLAVENSHSWKLCQRKFATAAAVAGLSLSLCSSALASPSGEAFGALPESQISENFQTRIETQLMHQLQSEIKAQRDWLDEIGQPVTHLSIDDRVRQELLVGVEDKLDSIVDEDGKNVSTKRTETLFVPIFKVSSTDLIQGKDKIPAATIVMAAHGAAHDKSSPYPIAISVTEGAGAPEPQRSIVSCSTTTAVSKSSDSIAQRIAPEMMEGPDLVAVTAVPLGTVVSAASRSVGPAGGAAVVNTMAALQGAPVPGMNLITRMMMHFGGGGVAGAMGATLVYPLDTVKTRMQAQTPKDGEEPHYKDEWDCLKKLIADEGLASLYCGLVPQLVGIAPEKAIKFTVNEVLMEMLESQLPGVGVWALELIAGGGGGFSQVVFTNPMEIVKVRLQTQSKDRKQKNSWDVVKELGLQGLYNGSGVTMARDIPSTAIFFAIYTFIRQLYPEQSFMAGCLAAIPATVLVTPLDVIKTRLQMEVGDGGDRYDNAWQCFVLILQKEGPGALFKGCVARVLKTSPQFGITLMLYNSICNLL